MMVYAPLIECYVSHVKKLTLKSELESKLTVYQIMDGNLILMLLLRQVQLTGLSIGCKLKKLSQMKSLVNTN